MAINASLNGPTIIAIFRSKRCPSSSHLRWRSVTHHPPGAASAAPTIVDRISIARTARQISGPHPESSAALDTSPTVAFAQDGGATRTRSSCPYPGPRDTHLAPIEGKAPHGRGRGSLASP